MNTVPDKVNQLVKSQMLHDRKQNEERSRMKKDDLLNTPKVDFLCPIVADADAGFGGITSVMKLTKLFIESGAAGIHLEDQKPGAKKCGHLGGKVLVSVREAATRLHAARLQADIQGCDLVIVARTDALSATLLDTNIDPIDHPFILGVVDSNKPKNLMTFPYLGMSIIEQSFTGEKKETTMAQWKSKCFTLSLNEALVFANKLGFSFSLDWEACRTDEGFYQV